MPASASAAVARWGPHDGHQAGRRPAEENEYPGARRLKFAHPGGNILGVYEPSA
jgi:hypothetical protein